MNPVETYYLEEGSGYWLKRGVLRALWSQSSSYSAGALRACKSTSICSVNLLVWFVMRGVYGENSDLSKICPSVVARNVKGPRGRRFSARLFGELCIIRRTWMLGTIARGWTKVSQFCCCLAM